MKVDSLSESYGIVKALKWVKFLQSYKGKETVARAIDKFIAEEVIRHPELKEEESY